MKKTVPRRDQKQRRGWILGAGEGAVLAFLAIALYWAPYLGTDDDHTAAALALFLGAPLVAGALVRSRAALAVPVWVGVLLVLTYVLELGGENEFWADPFAIPTIAVMSALEVGCVVAGTSLRRHLAM